MNTLYGKRIAVLIADGFTSAELNLPMEALLMAGAEVDILSTRAGTVIADEEQQAVVALNVADADPGPYAALLIPGGAAAIEHLRAERTAMSFVDSFVKAGRPIAVVGHGATLLADLGHLAGRAVAVPRAARAELVAAGAVWVDAPVSIDRRIVSGRSAGELTDFNNAMVEAFAAHPLSARTNA